VVSARRVRDRAGCALVKDVQVLLTYPGGDGGAEALTLVPLVGLNTVYISRAAPPYHGVGLQPRSAPRRG